MESNSVARQAVLDEYNCLCEEIKDTVKPVRMPFVTFFDAATAEQNIVRNAECAVYVLASEKLFHKAIGSSESEKKAFESAKSELRAYYHSGLQHLLHLDLLMPIDLLMRLNLKDESQSYSDLVLFYRNWTGLRDSTNENNRKHSETIALHREIYRKYITG